MRVKVNVPRVGCLQRDQCLLAGVRAAASALLPVPVPVQQVWQRMPPLHDCIRHHFAVRQPGVFVHDYLKLHVEVLLVAVFSLVHLRVAFAPFVFGRAGRGDDGCVNHRTLSHQQAALAQVRVDLCKDRLCQVVLL